MVYNLHITTDGAGALLELSDSLADQLEGVVEAFNRTIHPAGGYRIYETIHLNASGNLKLMVEDTDGYLKLKGKGFEIPFNKSTGLMENVTSHGEIKNRREVGYVVKENN